MVLVSILCLVATLCCFVIFHVLPWKRSAGMRYPPSPPRLPLIGNLHQLGHLPHRSIHAMAVKYGPIMLLRLGRVPVLVVSSADMAEEVLRTQDNIFSSRPWLEVPNKLFYGGKDIAFAPYGEYWRQCRKLVVLHLLSAKRVQSFKHIREEEVSRMIKSVSSKHTLGPINLSDELSLLSRQMISRVTIGQCSGKDWYHEIHDVIKECSVMMGSFNPGLCKYARKPDPKLIYFRNINMKQNVGDYFSWLPWLNLVAGLKQKLDRTFRWTDRVLDTIIENRTKQLRDGAGEECFVDIMLNLIEDESIEIPFGINNVKALIMDLFGAGTESTTITMEWIMAEIIRNPGVMKKLQEEIRRIAGSRSLIQEDLTEMTYLKAVIKETLRLHPPGPFLVPRELIQDTKIRGYSIPHGAQVLVSMWAIGRDPKLWDFPTEFRPERFIETQHQVDYKGQDFEFIPFGAGRRVCPGIGFAMTIVELAITNLLLKFDWSISDEMDMDEVFGVTLSKKTRLCAMATPIIP